MTKPQTSIALGFFDGVHTAHKEIILSAVNTAKEKGMRPVALTFDYSPRELLSSEKIEYLTPLRDKTVLIKELGCELYILHTTSELLGMEPQEFVSSILVKKLNAGHICYGYNYRFGKYAKGDTHLLQKMGDVLGFTTSVFAPIELLGESVSSSRIRALLKEGEIEKANTLLGRNFSLSGIVTEGKHLGKALGFPTANIYPDKTLVTPKRGVYKTIVTTPIGKFSAITNVGINPTVGGEEAHLETYIPSFSSDLYSNEIKVEFISFLREEKKFETVEELKNQIQKDVDSL